MIENKREPSSNVYNWLVTSFITLRLKDPFNVVSLNVNQSEHGIKSEIKDTTDSNATMDAANRLN